MSEIKLLNCPFCGGEAEMEEDYSYGHGLLFSYKPHCSKCGCNIGMFQDKTEAIEKWNTRKPMERIVERVEEARQKYQRLQKEQGEKEDEAINILFRGMMKIVKEEGGIE